MSLKYLKKLRPILNKVGIKHGIPVEEGEFIIDLFFSSFKKAITDPRIPKVMLPMFGTFQPKIGYIYRSLKASIRFHKLGGTTREYINARIRRIWPIRNRLIAESNKEITWNEWRKENKLRKFMELERYEKEERARSKEVIYGSDNNRKKSERIFREVQTGFYTKRSQGRESKGI